MTTIIRPGARRIVAAVALLLPSLAGAQSIAERARSLGTGNLRFSFASRAEVCGNGHEGNVTIRSEGRTYMNRNGSGRGEWEADECEPGPVRVSVTMEDGRPVSLRTYVGGRWRAGGENVVDIGSVSTREASDWLLDVAERGSGKPSSNAIFAATLADSVTVWPRLMRIARDEDRPRDTRKQAVFWLSQAAGDAATAGLDMLAQDGSVDREVRKQAVFALSQRPRSEGVPALVRIARSSKDPEVRRNAIFWLGQSEDPRALALFEELLGRP